MIHDLWLLVFDLVLVGTLIALAVAALSSPEPRRAVMLFIAFGLWLSLVWARLRAPDVALAEAAIGAGLGGALMLAAARRQARETAEGQTVVAQRSSPLAIWGLAFGSLIAAGALLWVYYQTLHGEPGTARLADLALDRVPESGVSNPVTSVLLNYRAYDTLLELGVLMAALMGIWSLGRAPAPFQPAGPALTAMVAWVVPLLILTAGYMLWIGASAPGGAFQAGALLGAAGVILRLAGHPAAGLPGETAQRWLITLGIAVFAVIGLALMGAGLGFLTYPAGQAKWLILAVESAATLAIGATLAAAYVGGGRG
jgi:multisubunit Na+/H+ antiporter MnhB subunit